MFSDFESIRSVLEKHLNTNIGNGRDICNCCLFQENHLCNGINCGQVICKWKASERFLTLLAKDLANIDEDDNRL